MFVATIRKTSLLRTARRRWGSARVVQGGPPKPKKRVPRLPGTALERKLVGRLLGRALSRDEMVSAIRLLRAGARIKELEINDRLETLLD
jgi:hypothetical protein